MNTLKNFWIYFIFIFLAIPYQALAQEDSVSRSRVDVQGIVFDKQTKQRVSRVYIYNTSSDIGLFNNTKGEFTLPVAKGDELIVAVEGYHPDTLTYQNQALIVFNLQRSAIRLQEVKILGQKDPDKELQRIREEFSTAYTKVGGDLFSVNDKGAGLSIDALYSYISRDGKNARKLQQIIERDYKESVIDYKFTTELVSKTVGLKGDKLADFMVQYRPNYYFVLSTNEYGMIQYIRSSYAQYLRNPDAFRLPRLKDQP